mmetsp:Transcript_20246/g.31637  ORF Transcript_20246/g.31637 Transcript_20246/m.31637 type:complete len:307 (+) Transcript_20246:114-1034(+)
MPDDKKVVETEIYNRFSAIVKEKFTSLSNDGSKINQLDDLDELYKRPEFAAEKRILNEMNSVGLSKGILSGLACFAFLRTSPRLISNYLRRRAGSSGADINAGAPNPFQKQASGSGYKFDSLQKNQNVERPGLLFRGVRLMLDSFVSLSIGAYASIFFTDTTKMMEKFSTVPLVEGRSLLSEQLCKDFTREFQQYDRAVWNSKHPSLTAVDVSGGKEIDGFRDLIQGFVVNCKRREIYETEIREEQGLGADDPVIIPTPGVPRDISLTLGDLLSTKESGDNAHDLDGGDEFFDTYFDSADEGDFKD